VVVVVVIAVDRCGCHHRRSGDCAGEAVVVDVAITVVVVLVVSMDLGLASVVPIVAVIRAHRDRRDGGLSIV